MNFYQLPRRECGAMWQRDDDTLSGAIDGAPLFIRADGEIRQKESNAWVLQGNVEAIELEGTCEPVLMWGENVAYVARLNLAKFMLDKNTSKMPDYIIYELGAI